MYLLDSSEFLFFSLLQMVVWRDLQRYDVTNNNDNNNNIKLNTKLICLILFVFLYISIMEDMKMDTQYNPNVKKVGMLCKTEIKTEWLQ